MKLVVQLIIGLHFIFLATSCEKVVNPTRPAINIDTNLFPGNWQADYPEITWTENANTNRNVLLEDYTGHTC